jgi:hypothetical protein
MAAKTILKPFLSHFSHTFMRQELSTNETITAAARESQQGLERSLITIVGGAGVGDSVWPLVAINHHDHIY